MLMIAEWRFKFIEKERELNVHTVRCCFICSDLCSVIELVLLSQSAI